MVKVLVQREFEKISWRKEEKMTRILILEDNKDSLKVLSSIIKNISADIMTVETSSIEEARDVLFKTDETFHAFMLDINLDVNNEDDVSGLVFAKEIRSIKKYVFTPIVMITSIAALELQAYRELHCYQYIVKPYEEAEIRQLIKKVLFQSGEEHESYVIVKKEGINYKLLCKDIICVKAIPRGVCIVLQKEEMKVLYLSIKQLMEKLPGEDFMQCHRMFVVNKKYIDYLDMVNALIHMKNGEEVEIGVTYKSKIKEALNG